MTARRITTAFRFNSILKKVKFKSAIWTGNVLDIETKCGKKYYTDILVVRACDHKLWAAAFKT